MVGKTSIIITGANGLVGLEVLSFLVRHFPDAAITALIRKEPVKRFPGVVYVQGDLVSGVPEALFKEEKSVLIHLASLLKAPRLQDYREVNVEGTKKLLQAGAGRIAKVIYGSSMSVYGQGPFHKVSEEAPCFPETDLAVSRAEAEEAVKDFADKNTLPAFLLRPRFLLGDRDKETLPALLKLYRKGLLVGDGTQRFSFIGVSDYARIIAHLALESVPPGPLNIAYRGPLALKDMYEGFGEQRSYKKIPARFLMALGKFVPPLKKIRTKLQLIGQDQVLDVDRLYSACPFMDGLDGKKRFHEIAASCMRAYETK